ncbi:MAG: hypothetical protein HKN49_14295, partial [Gammaproteobacteria bacterium]|nr:hypothetical protein [Gammaproteobacteria bacterium]
MAVSHRQAVLLAATGPVPPPAPQSPPRSRHLWLCIGLPQLAVEAAGMEATAAVAIIDGEARQCRVHATNALAREHGVRNGMDLNAAYALCPAL